jgi:hypothetical protein
MGEFRPERSEVYVTATYAKFGGAADGRERETIAIDVARCFNLLMDPKGEITNIESLLALASKEINLYVPHAHIRYCWRGHSDRSWELRPGVYRRSFAVTDEEKRLQKERHLAQEFRIESAGLRQGTETMAQLYFLQQHFGLPTRLLDWTNNALAALFFAVTDKPDKSGAVFLMDAYQLSPTQKAGDEGYNGIAPSGHPLFIESMKQIFEWRDGKFPSFVMAVRPEHFDRRINLQRSCFTFHVPNREQLTSKENSSLVYFNVPPESKKHILRELALLGIDHFSLYGDLASLAAKLKAAHEVIAG